MKKHGTSERALVHDVKDFRNAIKKCMVLLHVQNLGYKMYGVRRGSATLYFKIHGSYDKTMEKGRWSCLKSLRTYLNEALQSKTEEKYTEKNK